MSEFEFNDPPAPKSAGKRSQYREFIAALLSRPGEWAVLPTDHVQEPRMLAYNINSARIIAFAPRGDFEAVSRAQPDGSIKVWVRYVGTT
jgi:hypothetical protein